MYIYIYIRARTKFNDNNAVPLFCRRVNSSIMTPENTELIQKSIYTLVFTLKNIEVRSELAFLHWNIETLTFSPPTFLFYWLMFFSSVSV